MGLYCNRDHRGTCGSHSENASFEQSATVNTGHIILLGFVSRLLLSGYVNSRFRRYVRIPKKERSLSLIAYPIISKVERPVYPFKPNTICVIAIAPGSIS